MKKMGLQHRGTGRWIGVLAALSLALGACQTGEATQSESAAQSNVTTTTALGESAFFTEDAVHTISVQFSEEDYQAMLDAYAKTQDKEWIHATVTIDGVTFEDAGLRLKGNSSLRSLLGGGGPGGPDGAVQDTADEGDGQVDAERPETLPWLIRLDKYVDEQSYSGRSDFVVRGNNSETSLNEAVALAILNEAGVPAQQAAFVRFSVNGSKDDLRVVVDLPDDAAWNQDHFAGSGYTYKADSEGDYSYRGTDPESYADAFKQKFGEEDMEPLIKFLDFINNATDQEFAENLGDYLEVEEFATYLAAQDLIANDDDIDGPGNNSYLHYSTETGRMTVVAWDHNLAFGRFGNMDGGGPGGQMPEGFDPGQMPQSFDGTEMPGGGGPGQPPDGFGGGEPPDGFDPGQMPQSFDGAGEMPEGFEPPERPEGRPDEKGFGISEGNILASRFKADENYAKLITEKSAELQVSLVDSGQAAATVAKYAELLKEQASDLVDAQTITSEAASIEQILSGESEGGMRGGPSGTAPGAGDRGEERSPNETPGERVPEEQVEAA